MLLLAGLANSHSLFQYRLTAPGAQSNTPTLRLAIISEGVNTWPLYVAQRKELFLRAGLAVDVTLTRSSVKQLEALKSGGYDIGFQQCDHVVRAVEQGSDLFMFMALAHAPELTLVVAPGIERFEDLRGKDIAVDGARTGYALLLRKLLSTKGLEDKDYAFLEIGGSRERYDALKNGSAVASLLNAPFDRNLLAAGFGSLGTTSQYFPTYTGSIAAARRSWARANAASLISFIKAMNAAFAWLAEPQHKAEAIDLLRSRLDFEPAVALEAYDQFLHRPQPQIREDGLRQVVEVVWQAEGWALPKPQPERYMDLSYIERAAAAK